MPDPLPPNIVANLRSNPTAALAAIMIIADAHFELLAWALRSLSPLIIGKETISRDIAANVAPTTPAKPCKANGEGARAKGCDNPREGAAKRDQALLALMRANPDASVTEIIEMNNRPRNSTMLSLERLEKAGLVEHAGRGRWVAIDPDLLEVPAPRPAGWIAPLSGAVKARHAADGRVRDELTMAAGA